VDSIQVQAGVEADGRQMAKLIAACQKDGVRVIGVEPQYSRGGAETLRKELQGRNVDIKIVTLDPIETASDDELRPGLYVERMRANLKTLADALP
jgi:ABC-type Zn uptake system ZnuABC Zn-binding protein ZnuA